MTTCVHFPELTFDLIFPGEEPPAVIEFIRLKIAEGHVLVITDMIDEKPAGTWGLVNFGAIRHLSVSWVPDGQAVRIDADSPGPRVQIQAFLGEAGEIRLYQ